MQDNYFDCVKTYIEYLKNSPKTKKRYAVIGDPVSHSLSPLLHTLAYPNCEYSSVRVTADQLQMFFDAARLYLDGFNITVPHKNAAVALVDGAEQSALDINSVNTVVCSGGSLHGYNTDTYGLISALNRHKALGGARSAAVLGAGGAAAAACYALKKHGLSVCVVARDIQKAHKALGGAYPVTDFQGIYNIPNHIVVNCTPVGMSSTDPYSAPVEAHRLRECRFILDTVYSPLRTQLLKDAQRAGIRHAGGLNMLIAQGCESQRIWGAGVPDKSFAHLEAALAARLIAAKLADSPRSIALCGFMGCGKSRVAKALAKLTGLKQADTDMLIEQQLGLDIPTIFTRHGEEFFRKAETETIAALNDGTPRIISLGGGAAVNEDSLLQLRKFCTIIYIKVCFDTSIKRTGGDSRRPLLTSGTQKAHELYKIRLPLYKKAADITVNGESPVYQVAADILFMLDI